MSTTIQLTKKKTSYVNQLSLHKEEINKQVNNPLVSLQQLKQYVRDVVISTNDKSLENKSQATKRFLMSLDKQKSKSNVLTLVWNSMLNGDGFGVI